MMTSTTLLEVSDLSVEITTRDGLARIVNGVSYNLSAGQTIALVGESGSGKTVSAMALLGLLPRRVTTIGGSARFGGRNLIGASEKELEKIRGNGIAMIFQDPMTSLNPVLSIGRQLTEGMQFHLGITKSAARDRATELLSRVGIPSPRKRLDDYPHQMSGGMRQRVMIAAALSCSPKVLIADEPTTALDVTTQAQLIDLIAELQAEMNMGVLWISHDLGSVAGLADDVMVFYGGEVVERAEASELYVRPQHPYTVGLLASVPRIGPVRPDRLSAIPGNPPNPLRQRRGCVFWHRCAVRADARCETERPPLRTVSDGHEVATFYTLGSQQ